MRAADSSAGGWVGAGRYWVTIGDSDAGARLDRVLAAALPSLSRSRLKALMLEGRVTSGGVVISEPSLRVKPGTRYAVDVPAATPPVPPAQAMPLAILFEDEHVIVVDKPAGLVVHPAPGNPDRTLVNALIAHCGSSLSGIGGVARPGIVHRLDKDTSGVMVAAKTERAQADLAGQFADHGRSGPLERRYRALVWGVPARKSGVIDAPLGRSARNRLKRAVVRATAPDARPAVTHYRVLASYGAAASLIECVLETGRTHQIRVHLAHAGHPLVGDPDYGGGFATKANRLDEPARSAARSFARQALHAAFLRFRHPASGRTMDFASEPPEDFRQLIQAFATMA
jgi:23S rRNA pseudouridine1911/1915/1917 synthase